MEINDGTTGLTASLPMFELLRHVGLEAIDSDRMQRLLLKRSQTRSVEHLPGERRFPRRPSWIGHAQKRGERSLHV